MRAVVQRVSEAAVTVAGETTGVIPKGLMVCWASVRATRRSMRCIWPIKL